MQENKINGYRAVFSHLTVGLLAFWCNCTCSNKKSTLCPIDGQSLIKPQRRCLLSSDWPNAQTGSQQSELRSVLCFHCQDNELRDYRVQAAVPHDHSDDEHSPEE